MWRNKKKRAALENNPSPPKKKAISINESDKRTQKNDQTMHKFPTEIHLPDAVEAQNQAANGRQERRDRWKLTAEWLTLAAVVFYGVVAYRQWDAMLTANDNATRAFHISEKAYIAIEAPVLDFKKKDVTLGLSNGGKIPSGVIDMTWHEATIGLQTTNGPVKMENALEYNWKHWTETAIAPGKNTATIGIIVPRADESKFAPTGVYQQIIIAGRLEYNDGFRDDPVQKFPFCLHTAYHLIMKEILWTGCSNPDSYISAMEKLDGYPNNEQHDDSASG
jgi:hypothetical protein